MTRFQEEHRVDLVFLEKKGVGLRALFEVPRIKTSGSRESHHPMTARKSTDMLRECKSRSTAASDLAICFSVKSGGRGNKSIQISFFGDAMYPWPYHQEAMSFKIWAEFEGKDDPSCQFEVVSEDLINPNSLFPNSVGFNEVALDHEVDIWEGRRFTCAVTLEAGIWDANRDQEAALKLLKPHNGYSIPTICAKLNISKRGADALLNYIYPYSDQDALASASANANVVIELLEAVYNYDLPTLKDHIIQLLCIKAEAVDFRKLEESESEHESDSELDVDECDYFTKEEKRRSNVMKKLCYIWFDDEDSGSDDKSIGAAITECNKTQDTSERDKLTSNQNENDTTLDDKSTRAVGGVREWLSIENKIRLYLWSFEKGCKDLMKKMMQLLKRSRSKLKKSRMFKELVTRGDPNFLKELGYQNEQKKGPNKEETGQEEDNQSSSTSSDEEHRESLEEETNQLAESTEFQIFLESLDRKGYGDVREKVVTLLKTERSKSKDLSLFEELMVEADCECSLSQKKTNPNAVTGKEALRTSTAEDDKDDMMDRSKPTQPSSAPLNNSIDTTPEGSGDIIHLDDPIVKIEVDEGSVDDALRIMQDELPVDNGDSLFEEEHHIVKYEIEGEAEEERSTTQSLNVNIDIDDLVISRNVPTPGHFHQREGTLLVNKTVDVYWKSGGAYLECSLCNYELRFSTYSEKGMAEAFKRMQLHVRENHKDQATERGIRFGERQPHQCTNLGCEALFANEESRDKHEVTHRTCDTCGKQVGEKGMSEKRKKAAMVAHKRSHESKRTSNQIEQKASSSKKRKIDQN